MARRRLANLRSQEEIYSPFLHLVVIPQIFSKTESSEICIKKLLLEKLSWGLRLARHEDSLILITQDDVQLCGNFMSEIATILDVAPAGWRSLHLCAGYMWGRWHRKPSLDRELPDVVVADPEWVVPKWSVVDGRFARLFAPAWPGGPLAFLIRRRSIAVMLRQLEATSKSTPDDVSLVSVATPDDYMLRQDLLCHEREHGGSQHGSRSYGLYFAVLLAVLCGIAICAAAYTRVSPEANARNLTGLMVFSGLVGFCLEKFERLGIPSSQQNSAAEKDGTVETPTRRQFLQQCGDARLALCEHGSGSLHDLPDPANVAAWLDAIEQLWKRGGCLRVYSALHHMTVDGDVQSLPAESRIGSVGLAFCSASLAEPVGRFSLLPCSLGPRHVVMRRIAFLAKCAISNGVRDREYLLALPESILCECLTGERRLPSTVALKQECLSAISGQTECCAVI